MECAVDEHAACSSKPILKADAYCDSLYSSVETQGDLSHKLLATLLS